MPTQYAITRYMGIVYLIKKELNGDFGVYTYDLVSPTRVGIWTRDSGITFTNDKVLQALRESNSTEELQEKCEGE